MSCCEYPCATPGCDGVEFTNSPPAACSKCGETEFGSPFFDEPMEDYREYESEDDDEGLD